MGFKRRISSERGAGVGELRWKVGLGAGGGGGSGSESLRGTASRATGWLRTTPFPSRTWKLARQDLHCVETTSAGSG